MTTESVERKPQTWSEALDQVNNKLWDTAKKLRAFSSINEDDYENVRVEKSNWEGSLVISTDIAEAELGQAPEEIRMLMIELGISDKDEVERSIMLSNVSEGGSRFHLVLKPKLINSDRIGVNLASNGNNHVLAPTTRVFDGVHQMTDAYFGRGEKIAELVSDKMRGSFYGPHPFMVDILAAGGNWMVDIIESQT